MVDTSCGLMSKKHQGNAMDSKASRKSILPTGQRIVLPILLHRDRSWGCSISPLPLWSG